MCDRSGGSGLYRSDVYDVRHARMGTQRRRLCIDIRMIAAGLIAAFGLLIFVSCMVCR